jgi:geranylgeranyl diphosphate synthase type I
MLDVDFTMRGVVSAEEAERKTQLKTASYTFVRPLQLGAILAGAGAEVEVFCELFGSALGSAFQLQDDLFDLIAAQEDLGKPVMNDIREGQQTPITAYFFAHASAADQAVFLERFGRSFPRHDESLVRDLLARSGSLSFAEQEIERHVATARDALIHFQLPPATKEALVGLVDYLAARTL